MKLKKYEKNPIIAPNPANAWENLVTCNPGVIYDDGRFYMLYRAAGDDKEHVIRLGLAVSENGFDFRRVGDSPVFGPSADGPDGGCVEDPRIVKFDNEFYITYAYRAHAPGQYWTFAHDVVRLPRCGAYAPAAMAQNLGNTGLAVTTDFRNFHRLGRLTSPVLDDRDVILFPEKIGGKFAMMHRPKQFVGEHYGVKYPSIWLKFSDDLLAWEDQAQPSAYRRPRRNLGGEDRRKHAADPDRGGVADALPRGSRRRHGRIPRRGAAARPGESAAGAGPDAGTDPRTRIFL